MVYVYARQPGDMIINYQDKICLKNFNINILNFLGQYCKRITCSQKAVANYLLQIYLSEINEYFRWTNTTRGGRDLRKDTIHKTPRFSSLELSNKYPINLPKTP